MSRLRALAGAPGFVVTGALLFLAAVYLGGIVLSADELGLGFDFRFQYYGGASAVVHGEPLYASPQDAPIEVGKAYVYPPPLAVALVPLTMFSQDTATLVAILGALAALWGALALVGVKDPRCYAAVVLTAPVWNLLETANVTALLALALALAWRFRSTVWPLAGVLGVAFAAKLFLWPLAVWTLGTRRYAATLRLVPVAVATLVLSWATVGFQGLRQYPELVSRLSEVHGSGSYSVVGMGAALGLGSRIAYVLALVVGATLLAVCVVLARRKDDVGAFTCAVAGALALTPILWQHYLSLLFVPLGIARPRFSAIWVLPVVLWIAPRVGNGHGIEPFLPALVAAVLVGTVLLRTPPRREAAARACA